MPRSRIRLELLDELLVKFSQRLFSKRTTTSALQLFTRPRNRFIAYTNASFTKVDDIRVVVVSFAKRWGQ